MEFESFNAHLVGFQALVVLCCRVDFIAVRGMAKAKNRPLSIRQGVIQRAVRLEVIGEVEDLIGVDNLVCGYDMPCLIRYSRLGALPPGFGTNLVEAGREEVHLIELHADLGIGCHELKFDKTRFALGKDFNQFLAGGVKVIVPAGMSD